ncbi:hypothetical protein [Bordetella petrii]|nr:hypothetical protein [Bordetella petrii]
MDQRIEDALYAARGRLLVPHDNPEARRDAVLMARVKLDEAIAAMLEASRELCKADRHDIAQLVDDARRAAGLADAVISDVEPRHE